MSLLNDALRKRRAERSAEGRRPAGTALNATRTRRFRLFRKPAILVGVAVFAMIFGVWCWWWPLEEPSSSVLTGLVQTAPLDAEKDDVPDIETPKDPSPSVRCIHPAEAETDTTSPVTARPAPVKRNEIRTPEPTPAPSAPISPPMSQAKQALPEPRQQAPAPVRTKAIQRPDTGTQSSSADAVTAAAPPAQSRNASAARIYRKARTYHCQGRLPEAVAMYREVLKIDPDHFDSGFNLTSAYLETQAFDKAYAMATDLYRKQPDNPQVTLNLAIAQIGTGRPRQALDLLARIAADPQAPLYEIYFHKGVAYRNLDQPDQAVAWYQKAERLKPGDPRLLFNTAVALDQSGQYGPAVTYYQNYLKSSPAEELSMQKRVAHRIRVLQAALAAHPTKEAHAQ